MLFSFHTSVASIIATNGAQHDATTTLFRFRTLDTRKRNRTLKTPHRCASRVEALQLRLQAGLNWQVRAPAVRAFPNVEISGETRFCGHKQTPQVSPRSKSGRMRFWRRKGKTDPFRGPWKRPALKTRLDIPFRGGRVYVAGRPESENGNSGLKAYGHRGRAEASDTLRRQSARLGVP